MPNAFGFRLWSRLLRMAPVGIPAGVHRQTRVGTGFDLAGIRPFEPGDDPRRLDAVAMPCLLNFDRIIFYIK